MGKFRVPNTYVIISAVLLLCAVSTWLVPGGVPQTWQIFSALYEGFISQSGIIAFVLVIGGAFWVVNSTRALDEGIMKFIKAVGSLERYGAVRSVGVGNLVIVLVMLLFGVFGAVFGMSEETIAFVAVSIPVARSLGYDEIVGVCMVYVAAHVGFAGAMLNPFTVGIAQEMSDLPLFSGIGYRCLCWSVLMTVTIAAVLFYASRVKRKNPDISQETDGKEHSDEVKKKAGAGAWGAFAAVTASLLAFSICYASDCVINIGQSSCHTPWLLWVADAAWVVSALVSLKKSSGMYILCQLMFTIVFLVVGVMGYGWYLPQICALFLALAVSSGVAAGYSPDKIAMEFISGAKDIFSAAMIIGFAAGIIVILEDGQVIDTMIASMAALLEESGRAGAVATMYGIQNLINIFIPSASAKAAITMPIMAPFSDMIGISRQTTVLAFQLGDGFTNMITPCSGVLMAVLSVARIPYEKWFRFIWKFILALIVAGFFLLLPTLYLDIPGF